MRTVLLSLGIITAGSILLAVLITNKLSWSEDEAEDKVWQDKE